MSDKQDKRNRSYFDFLITDYGFKYHGYCDGWTIYYSEKTIIECYVDRSIPSIRFKLPSEPDDISTSFDHVLETLGKIESDIYREMIFIENPERGIIILKSMFSDVADLLINKPEIWWLDSQKLGFDRDEDIFLRSGQDVTNLPFYRKYYQYIKSKDPNWSSKIHVPDDWNT